MRWTELLASHDQRMADGVSQHRGRVVKQTGDGILAMFDGAARALRCTVHAIGPLRASGWPSGWRFTPGRWRSQARKSGGWPCTKGSEPEVEELE